VATMQSAIIQSVILLSVTMLSVTMLSITMLSVTMLSVVAPRRLLKISLVVKFEETKMGKDKKKFFWSKKLENKNENRDNFRTT
jgi:hypothetical protein